MEHLGRVIVVPVVNPASVHPLLVAAARIADADGGLVVPLTVIPVRADADVRAHAWNGVADAESIACELGVRAQGVVVEADDVVAGTLQAVADHDASLVLMGWRGRSSTSNVFGELIDSLVGRSSVPLAIVRLGAVPVRRVVLPVHSDHLLPGGRRGLALATELARRLGATSPEPTTVLRTGDSEAPLPPEVAALGDRVHHDPRRNDRAVGAIAQPSDVVVAAVAPTVSGLRSATTHLAWAAPDSTLMVAVDVGPTHEEGLAEAAGAAATPAPVKHAGSARQVRIVVTARLPEATGPSPAPTPEDLDRVLRGAGSSEHLMAWWPAGDTRPHVRATVTVTATSVNAAISAVMVAVHEAPDFRGAEITYDVDRGAPHRTAAGVDEAPLHLEIDEEAADRATDGQTLPRG
ncbi:universal stress protein [Nitriliruptor alkaliphilus]|uniref:universal stress protein n=1 Tax=Nitriliruptor alkaliphilus TaxID=427918 RepID=UPI000695E6DA|nr:universal stress protein [Nitriliruptor alkaliphilus]